MTILYITLSIGLAAIVVSIIYALESSKKIAEPLITLSDKVKVFGTGNYQAGIDQGLLIRSDEVGLLSKSFEAMRLQLLALFKEQADIQKKLEMRNLDLEDMNKVMIGRELKMIELKKELDSLKNTNPARTSDIAP
jgi:HAMP domain-containing protein